MTNAATAPHTQGAVRPDLTIAQAADRLWWYGGPWAYRGLVKTRGRNLDECEAWLADSLYSQVMAPHKM